MDATQIGLVQRTFAKVRPISDDVAAMFYGRLFELDPSLKGLFKGDMVEQGRKLMQTLTVAVSSLTNLETILPTVQTLGRNHVHYGVKNEYYTTVGEALLWTLEQGLQGEFTPEVKEAWTITYTTLADVMKNAAAQA